MKKTFPFVLAMLAFAGCGKDGTPKGEAGFSAEDYPSLEWALHHLGYAAMVADLYSEGQRPTSILAADNRTVIASVFYLPNGMLDYITLYSSDGKSYVYGNVYYYTDMGRRPRIATGVSTKGPALSAASTIQGGNYDYANNPVEVVAYFGGWTGEGVFGSLEDLKRMSNNEAISEEIYNTIHFPTNSYKLIVFGRNREGVLIGKYVGYSLDGKTFNYWCVDSENASFGQQDSKNTPYF
jgi:hypothetical protein